jgi:Domain of unknown function (DUF4157)
MLTFAKTQAQPQRPSFSPARSNTVNPGPDYHRYPIQHLQRGIGNQVMPRMLQDHAAGPEASSTAAAPPRFAHDFSRTPIHPPAAGVGSPQVMRMAEPEVQLMQAQHCTPGARERAEVPSSVYVPLRSAGQALEGGTRDFMETRFGYDFSRVRVHTDPRAAESARAVNAVAYTIGNDIVFDTDRYAPGTHQGRYLLAHELAHVVQQGGQPPSQIDKLSMTTPGDAHELQANTVAGAVTGGATVPSGTVSGTTVARQVDAGVADAAPSDATPVAGAAAPDKAPVAPPAAPARAPVAPPSVTFGKVAADARADRIPPTKSVDVPVTLANIPPGRSVTIDVEGSGAGNGTAALTAGASLAASGKVTLEGGTQTPPGNAGKLKLRAKLGPVAVGRSAGFTVAAYPVNYTDTYLSDIDDGVHLGMMVQDGWSSDGGGAISELDQVEISERVDMQSRDNPPFTVAGATSATSGTSGYNPANALTQDTFQMAKAGIDSTGLSVGWWTRVQGQLCLFKCKRTGVSDVVMPASGYRIIQVAYNFSPFAPAWKHKTFHVPATITVEGRTATSGGGTAESPEHDL